MPLIPDTWPESEKEKFNGTLKKRGVLSPRAADFPELWTMVETHAPELIEEFEADLDKVRREMS